jgi:hypothetical protein
MWHREAKIIKDIQLTEEITILKGTIVDITHGKDYKYAIWNSVGIWDVPKKYEDHLKILNFYDPRNSR